MLPTFTAAHLENDHVRGHWGRPIWALAALGSALQTSTRWCPGGLCTMVRLRALGHPLYARSSAGA